MLDLKAMMSRFDGLDPTAGGVWHSYPLPQPGSRLVVRAFYAFGRFDGTPGLVMSPVTRVAEIDAESGEAVSNQEITGGAPLGRSGNDFVPDEYEHLVARLDAAYRKLIPEFARGRRSDSAELKQDVAVVLDIFPRLQGRSLMPTVWQYGKDWMSWLGATPP